MQLVHFDFGRYGTPTVNPCPPVHPRGAPASGHLVGTLLGFSPPLLSICGQVLRATLRPSPCPLPPACTQSGGCSTRVSAPLLPLPCLCPTWWLQHPFELHDDSFVLRAMGLANDSQDGVPLAPPGFGGAPELVPVSPGQQVGGGTPWQGQGSREGDATGAQGPGQAHQGMGQGAGAGAGGGGPPGVCVSNQSTGPLMGVPRVGSQAKGRCTSRLPGLSLWGASAQHYGGGPAPFSGGGQYGPAGRGGTRKQGLPRQISTQRGPTCDAVPASAAASSADVRPDAHVSAGWPSSRNAPAGSSAGGFPNQQPGGSYQQGAVFNQQGGPGLLSSRLYRCEMLSEHTVVAPSLGKHPNSR